MKAVMDAKKWFPGYIANITFRRPDKYDVAFKRDFFDTWEQAHAFMLERATKDLAQSQKKLRSAERHLAKVKVMAQPDSKLGTVPALVEAE